MIFKIDIGIQLMKKADIVIKIIEFLDNSAKIMLGKVKKYSINKNIKILDLGCNVGRHLNYLKI